MHTQKIWSLQSTFNPKSRDSKLCTSQKSTLSSDTVHRHFSNASPATLIMYWFSPINGSKIGEIRRKKVKASSQSSDPLATKNEPVKIAFTSKTTEGHLTDYPGNELYKKLVTEAKNQPFTSSKRSHDEVEEESSPTVTKRGKISPKNLPENQTIIKGPKKVMRVLLKKMHTAETIGL